MAGGALWAEMKSFSARWPIVSLTVCLLNCDVSSGIIFLNAEMETQQKQLKKEQFILAQGLRIPWEVTVAALGDSWIHCSWGSAGFLLIHFGSPDH